MCRRLVLALALLLTLGAGCASAQVAHAGTAGGGSCSAGTVHNNGGMTGFGTCIGTVHANSFSYTPAGTNNGILIGVLCSASAASPTVTVTATSWTITQVGSVGGTTTTGFLGVFKAYALNTSATTFTITWTGGGTTCGGFMSATIDEFSGVDLTNFIDASSTISTGASGCPTTSGGAVTPVANNDGVWFYCADTITAVAGSYTKGGDDGGQDWSEWQILSGGAAVSKASAWTSSGNAVTGGVAIKPAAGGGATRGLLQVPSLGGLGIGGSFFRDPLQFIGLTGWAFAVLIACVVATHQTLKAVDQVQAHLTQQREMQQDACDLDAQLKAKIQTAQAEAKQRELLTVRRG